MTDNYIIKKIKNELPKQDYRMEETGKNNEKLFLKEIITGEEVLAHDKWYEDKKPRLNRERIKDRLSFAYLLFPLFLKEQALIKKVFNKYFNSSKKYIILDIGCGFGSELIKKYGNVVGIDVSASALSIVSNIYDLAIQIDSGDKTYPFADKTFDIIFHSNLEAHIPFENKDQFWKEQRRILKDSGKIIMVTEDIVDVWPYGRAFKGKKSQELIRDMGHFGFERLQDKIKRIKEHDFKVLDIKKIDGSVGSFYRMYNWYRYAEIKTFRDRMVLQLLEAINGNIFLEKILTAIINPLATVEVLFRKPEQCFINLVVVEKRF
jgi:SAM-dependent methyltransferase